MSVTGIVLFVIFLLVKSLLDKKKKEARRQKAPESSASPDEMGGTAETTQVMAENPTEVRDLLRCFLDERAVAVETRDVPSEALSEIPVPSHSILRPPACCRRSCSPRSSDVPRRSAGEVRISDRKRREESPTLCSSGRRRGFAICRKPEKASKKLRDVTALFKGG